MPKIKFELKTLIKLEETITILSKRCWMVLTIFNESIFDYINRST